MHLGSTLSLLAGFGCKVSGRADLNARAGGCGECAVHDTSDDDDDDGHVDLYREAKAETVSIFTLPACDSKLPAASWCFPQPYEKPDEPDYAVTE